MKQHFDHVDTWVFDLDNTLYPPSAGIFDQMDGLMNDWIARELRVSHDDAQAMRESYLEQYGTTLGGLMLNHGIDADAFLAETHDLDLGEIEMKPALRAAIDALPGRKYVFTNGSREHARRVTAALGLDGVFDQHYAIEDANYISKPRREAYDRVFAAAELQGHTAAMFEDMAENLIVPHSLGFRTVLVHPHIKEDHGLEHIHHVTDDLTGFLRRLTDAEVAA
ncbi:pyrimidine 5'-nucleotidase [Roseobacter sp. HKCCA0434]|uniref:pyrimidine 5'-nucleotidase n=1 Tax=Roseobacter sp. HKCCA0434 TaxID=3079297 RepID=UPI002905944B|nr:pyrimidine 5'-nucleotidase [Roseobacter sp. HKCCA0434]